MQIKNTCILKLANESKTIDQIYAAMKKIMLQIKAKRL
jgi:hypothetical protein